MERVTETRSKDPPGGAPEKRAEPEPASHSPLSLLRDRLGNTAFGRIVQAKLRIAPPGDPLEYQADRIAEEVTRPVAAGPPILQRKCAECEHEDEETPIHRKADNASTTPSAGPNTSVLGPGEPLPADTRAGFEARFGAPFSAVRIHRDAYADESARAIGARAYTLGNHIAFAAGEYDTSGHGGRLLLAHELAHVVQQGGAPRDTIYRSTPPGSGGTPGPPGSPAPPHHIAVDVLSARDPEDFLVRAAAQTVGADIRVRSMDDMATQLAARASGNTCISQLRVYNHGNPQQQAVVGGSKTKNAAGVLERSSTEGFSLTWLLDNANQTSLNRLRGSLCCHPDINWFGCSTAGVIAEGGERTQAERDASTERYGSTFGSFYHSVADALAHGATRFTFVGPANVQSWANALCASITAATDFNSWSTSRGTVTRTVIYGGQQLRFTPQSDIDCACDPATGRTVGSAPTAAEMSRRATYFREFYLRQLYGEASALGSEVTVPEETAQQRAAREQAEQRDAALYADLGNKIREEVLTHAGFTGGAQPTTPDEALRVTHLWGLDLPQILSSLPVLTTSTAERTTGTHTPDDMATQQRAVIDALTPRGRETFMSALAAVRQEHFWSRHLATHTIYMLPDLSGVNRYRGYTQTATGRTGSGRTTTVYVIHLSKDLLENGQTELAAASMVHELSHTLDTNVTGRAMREFESGLADLIANHPQIAALRASAPDQEEARRAQAMHLRQMIFDATGYAEGEIFVHLQQLTHQPSMQIGSRAVGAADFILAEVTDWIRKLRRIGMPRAVLNQLLSGVIRRAMQTYDARIAAAPVGSSERHQLEVNKQLAQAMLPLALHDSATP